MGVSLVLPGGDARRSTNTRLKAGEIMFGSHKVKIEGELLEKVKQCSDAAGYESGDRLLCRGRRGI